MSQGREQVQTSPDLLVVVVLGLESCRKIFICLDWLVARVRAQQSHYQSSHYHYHYDSFPWNFSSDSGFLVAIQTIRESQDSHREPGLMPITLLGLHDGSS